MNFFLARIRQHQTSICLEPFLSNPHLFGHATIGSWWSMLPLCCTRAGPGWLLIKSSWRMDESTCLCCKSGCDPVSWLHTPPWPSSLPRGCVFASLINVSLSLASEQKHDEDREWKFSVVPMATIEKGKKGRERKGNFTMNLRSTHQWMSSQKTVDVLSSQYQALFLQQ